MTTTTTEPKTNAKAAHDYCLSRLRRNPNASFHSIRDAAEKRGLVLSSVSFARAHLELGIAKPREPGRKAGSNGADPATVTTSGSTGSFTVSYRQSPYDDDIRDIQLEAHRIHAEGQRLRAALETIRDLLDASGR